MEINQYLQRINYQGPVSPTAETLRQLQVAHLQSVPFENLSIHAKEPIILNDEALFEKIVTRRRGGFCYELNGLFAALLRDLGFTVDRLSARVWDTDHFTQEFDHMALLVQLEDRWLADVGFGDSFLEPLLLDERGEQVQGTRSFRIVEDDDHLILMRDSEPQYRFTLQPYGFADYEEMCRFHQTSPESHFTRGRICSLATEDGRVTLSDMRLITTRDQLRDERLLADQDEYNRMLRDTFGIVMK